MTLKVIAFDPGGTTGYAVGFFNKEVGLLKVRAGQEAWMHKDLYSQLTIAKPDYLVCESFEYRNKSRAGLVLISCEFIGIVKLYVAQNPLCRLDMQNAAKGKGYFKDEKLKEANLWLPGKGHAMDALRHLLQWWTFEYGYQFNKEGFCPE